VLNHSLISSLLPLWSIWCDIIWHGIVRSPLSLLNAAVAIKYNSFRKPQFIILTTCFSLSDSSVAQDPGSEHREALLVCLHQVQGPSPWGNIYLTAFPLTLICCHVPWYPVVCSNSLTLASSPGCLIPNTPTSRHTHTPFSTQISAQYCLRFLRSVRVVQAACRDFLKRMVQQMATLRRDWDAFEVLYISVSAVCSLRGQ
jgi:hypothetical protein